MTQGTAASTGVDWVALYAAVVATASVGWQAYTWHEKRRSRLRIYLSLERNPNYVEMEVHNLSEHTVHIRWAAFEKQKRWWDPRRAHHVVVHEPLNQISEEITPRGIKIFGMNRNRFEAAGFDAGRKLRGFVVDAENERHYSKRASLQ